MYQYACEYPLEFSKAAAYTDYAITDLILIIPVCISVPHIAKCFYKSDLSASVWHGLKVCVRLQGST